jgi:DNA/RNA endonuclease YhcR with UshA esterase domain
MNSRIVFLLGVAAGLTAAVLPAGAHHSFPAQYDINKPITLTGKVTKVEWTNPHIFIYADIANDKGAVTNWAFEMGGPNALIRQGWKRDSLKVGDTVTMEGSLARDGSPLVNARVVTVDGRKLFAGSSGGDQAPPPAAQ